MPKSTTSEGSSFAQKETFDKKYWKNKDCFKCGKTGHPANFCKQKNPKKGKQAKANKDDDDQSVSSSAESVRKLNKDINKMKKNFATVNTQLNKLKEEADGSDLSESNEEEDSHFQVCHEVHFTQFDEEFEPRIAKLFKQADASKIKLDLK